MTSQFWCNFIVLLYTYIDVAIGYMENTTDCTAGYFYRRLTIYVRMTIYVHMQGSYSLRMATQKARIDCRNFIFEVHFYPPMDEGKI